jgi:hypothetical protein
LAPEPLKVLQQDCVQAQVSLRPDFASIVARL